MQRFSGISVHSIRAWEKRYNALNPERSEGNTRYYNGNQLRRLLNIASLMNSEYKISDLCSFPDSKLHELILKKISEKTLANNDEFLVSQLVAAALEFDELYFDKVYSRAIIQHGMEDTYLKLIYPALERLGIMWSANRITSAQEHFISNLIRQKLNTSIDMITVNGQSQEHWLLFLPENEFHEIGLLMANYLVRNARQRCTYLGANVPNDTLKYAVKILKPTSLLFFLVKNDDVKQDAELIRQMLKSFPAQKIFIAAQEHRFIKIKKLKNFTPLKSAEELRDVLKTISK